MSREVEVKNIQMTATVPEDIQISLGHLQYVAGGTTNVDQATAKNFTGLTDNEGILEKAGGSNADNGNVKAPLTGTDAVSMLDWSSSADISQYYRLGKIIPASSTTGENIFFTPDAAGVGKSLKAGAAYYQAANMTSAFTWDTTDKTFKSGGSGGDSAMTTLHAINSTNRANDKWNDGLTAVGEENTYATAAEWFDTNDDGYYVDIPVWFRSSAKDDISLSVDAYVTTNAAKDEDDLYLAARAVILYNSTPAIDAAPAATSNLLRIRQDALSETKSIVDFMYTTNSTGDAVNAVDATNKTATYTDATEYTGTGLVKVPAGTNNSYGTPTKAIIRVWLEGEDPNCWNQNAGQNFNISLRFSKDDLSATGLNTYPATSIDQTNKAASTADGSLKDGQQVTVTVGNTTPDTLVFEYHSKATPKWDLIDGTFHTLEGKTYTFNNVPVTNSDQIAAQLEAMGTKKSTFESGLSVSVSGS